VQASGVVERGVGKADSAVETERIKEIFFGRGTDGRSKRTAR
jgi:hypothetical protein